MPSGDLEHNLPVFVSFPRAGAHWLNCVMELYFDRPRLPRERTTFLPLERDDWMWVHDHDLDASLPFGDVLYLWRDPADVLFSFLVAEHGKVKRKHLEPMAQQLRAHARKYLDPGGAAKTVITYKACRDDLPGEFAKVAEHFGQAFDPQRLEHAAAIVTKEALVEQTKKQKRPDQYMSKKLLAESYAEDRDQFRQEHGDWIREFMADTPAAEPAG